MSSTTATPMSADQYKMARRVAISSSLGTAMEWIDFVAYGVLAATVFPALFFPSDDPAMGLIASFATFGVGYGARPLGAIVFGYLGDRFGRKHLLLITMMTMGVVSLLMALLPTYASIGIWAPAMLVMLRFLQGMALGGESTGAQILTLEHAPRDKRGIYGAYTQIGNPGSQLICNGMLALLSAVLTEQQFNSFGWRIPFLASFALLGIGIYMRLRVDESPVFSHAVAEGEVAKRYVLRSHPWTVLRLLVTWGGVSVPSLLMTTFAVAYATKNLGMSYNSVFLPLMVATGFAVVPLLFGGWISDRIGRRKAMLFGSGYLFVVWLPFFPLLHTANPVLVGLAMTLVYGGVMFMVGLLPALFAEPFPTDVRYSGSALAYTGSQLVFSAPAPLVAAIILREIGGVFWIAVIAAASIVVTFVLTWFSKETAGIDLDDTHLGDETPREAAQNVALDTNDDTQQHQSAFTRTISAT